MKQGVSTLLQIIMINSTHDDDPSTIRNRGDDEQKMFLKEE